MSQINFSHDTDTNKVYLRFDGKPIDVEEAFGPDTLAVHPRVNIEIDDDAQIVGIAVDLRPLWTPREYLESLAQYDQG